MDTSWSDRLYELFWDERFWLNEKYKWEDLEPKEPGVYFPKFRDIGWQSFGLGLLFLIVQLLYYRLLVNPFAHILGVRAKKIHKVKDVPALENEYMKSNGGTFKEDSILAELSKKTELSEKSILNWLRKRKSNDKPGRLQKFQESSWQFGFYLCSFYGGLYVFWNKPWLWKTKLTFENLPYQHVENDLYWFYLLELAFYWHQIFTIMFERKRKDFYQMIIHHVMTIWLMTFSWVINFPRIGALVVLVHDAVDYWLFAAKMAIYAKRDNLSTFLFGVFVLVWTVSRLVVYPFWILYACIVEVREEFGDFVALYVFDFFLVMLLVLHIRWTIMIYSVAIRKLSQGSEIKDTRSDSEFSDDEEMENETSQKRGCVNGEKPATNGFSHEGKKVK